MRHTGGWVKLHKKIFDNWIGQDSRSFVIFCYLLSMANYKDSKLMVDGKLTTIKRGQIVTSYRELAERWGFVYRTVKRRCDALEADNVIVQQVSHRGTIITICNYEKYQEVPKGKGNTEGNTLSNTEGNAEGSAEGSAESNSESIHIKKLRREEIKEVKNNTLSSTTPKKKAPIKYDQWDLGIANQLIQVLQTKNPDGNYEGKAEKWANDFRLLKKKHDPQRIEKALDWVFQNDFWQNIVQSPRGLKNNWNQISAKMNSKGEMSLDDIATAATRMATKPADPNEIDF